MRTVDADALKVEVKKALLFSGDFMAQASVAKVIDDAPTVDQWHYPSKGELPDKDWTKHPLNVSKKCFVLTKRGIGTIAKWDNDYKIWFEKNPFLPVPEVIAWQYFIPPKEEA